LYQWERKVGWEMVKEGEYWYKSCVCMYVNGKIIPVETIPGMG
jgi:hypothetical protein